MDGWVDWLMAWLMEDPRISLFFRSFSYVDLNIAVYMLIARTSAQTVVIEDYVHDYIYTYINSLN